MNSILVRKFSVNKNKLLSKQDKKLLTKLEKAAELVANIYGLQMNDKYPGANFYPHDASKEEILKANENNPLILNPYTIVKRNKNGSLEAVPYHVEYAEQLKPITKLLREASGLTDNKEFATRLQIQADALENGSYEAADIYGLSMTPNKIIIVIGPYERYDDRLFFTKTAYHAVVGVLSDEDTAEGERLKEAMLTTHRKNFSLSQRVEASRRIPVRVDNVTIIAGLYARALFIGSFLPNDPNLMERYGVKMMLYKNALKENFENFYLSVFKKIFARDFQKSFDSDLLFKAAQQFILIRMFSTSFVKYHDAEKRLGSYYSMMNEVTSHVLAVKHAGMLMLKDTISQKELEGVMIILLCRALSTVLTSQHAKLLTSYSQGYTIVLNYFFEAGALVEYQGLSWVNFTKMYMALDELAKTLEKILAFGDEEDARRLLQQYGDDKELLKIVSRV